MNDKTFLSLSGGSGLPITTFLKCPRWFHYVAEGFRMRYTKIALAHGILFHHYAEKIMKGTIKPEELDNASNVLLSGKWTDEPRNEDDKPREIEWDLEEMDTRSNQRSVDKAVKVFPGMLNKLIETKDNNELGKVVEIEKIVVVDELIKPKGKISQKEKDKITKLVDNGIVFSGRYDFKTDDNKINDFKTSAKEWTQGEADDAEQFSIYGYAESIDTGELVTDFIYHVYTKHVKGCRYQNIPTTRDWEDYNTTYENLLYVGIRLIQCTEEKNFPKEGKMRCSCKDDYFQRCPYYVMCWPNRFADKEREIEENKIIKI